MKTIGLSPRDTRSRGISDLLMVSEQGIIHCLPVGSHSLSLTLGSTPLIAHRKNPSHMISPMGEWEKHEDTLTVESRLLSAKNYIGGDR